MTSFCATSFWDNELSTHATDPDVTECFLSTVVYLPCLFLWLFAPYYAILFCKRNTRDKGFATVVFVVKLVLVVLLILAAAISLIYALARGGGDDASHNYVTPAFLLVTFVLDAVGIALHRKSGHARSYVQFVFWLLMTAAFLPGLVFGIKSFSSDNEIGELEAFNDGFRITAFFLSFFSLIASAVSDYVTEGLGYVNPEVKASVYSDLFFSWLNGLIWEGYKNPLEKGSVPTVKSEMTAAAISEAFDRQIDLGLSEDKVILGAENTAAQNGKSNGVEMLDIAVVAADKRESKKPSQQGRKVQILIPLFMAFGGKFLVAILLKIVQDVLKFVAPQVLKFLIRFVQAKDDSAGIWKGYFLACSLFVVNTVQLLVLQQYWKRAYQAGMEMKVAAISAIYRKSFKLCNSAKKEYSLGQIVNLMSTDAQTIQEVLPTLNMLWSMPFQIILVLYFLYHELGVAVFAGAVILVLLIPFNIFTSRLSRQYQSSQMKCKDKRIRIMYEVLNSIKIIKLNAWEESFEEKVAELRAQEIAFLRKNARLKAFINFVFGCAPILVTLASFGTYVSINEDNYLTADKVFVCISLCNLLRLPMHLLPFSITEFLRLMVSVKRINKFLEAKNMATTPLALDVQRKDCDSSFQVILELNYYVQN